MEKHRLMQQLGGFQGFRQLPDIVAVKGAVISKAQVSKYIGAVQHFFQVSLDPAHEHRNRAADQRQAAQCILHIAFRLDIAGSCTHV